MVGGICDSQRYLGGQNAPSRGGWRAPAGLNGAAQLFSSAPHPQPTKEFLSSSFESRKSLLRRNFLALGCCSLRGQHAGKPVQRFSILSVDFRSRRAIFCIFIQNTGRQKGSRIAGSKADCLSYISNVILPAAHSRTAHRRKKKGQA
jgi:hypothetical protein